LPNIFSFSAAGVSPEGVAGMKLIAGGLGGALGFRSGESTSAIEKACGGVHGTPSVSVVLIIGFSGSGFLDWSMDELSDGLVEWLTIMTDLF